MKAFGRSGRAVGDPLCSDDFARTRRFEKRGQVSVRINPPFSCSCFTAE